MTVHHAAIVTSNLARSLRFWRDGLGLAELMDHTFTGDWPTLFDATTDVLRSVFLGDPRSRDAGVVELVVFEDAEVVEDPMKAGSAPRTGFFLLSLQREVEPTLANLATLGFNDGVRRIAVRAPAGKTVQMAVITAPDGVRVELVGAPA
ncbi:VOC family protein [Mycobacterium sp. 94-17]|uniref:VOC family protein n=1 Tax=Mycobacterium sp. 94-17 TaxID=2986147 RepID=UPI002D1F26B7|nr:VOC family protein [Mycobacterium sp. 94-17]MEB4208048.1 VOC family protein [Mycobacterium sp. 94-17]